MHPENSKGGRLSAKKSLQVTTVTEQEPEGQGGRLLQAERPKEQSLSSKKHGLRKEGCRDGAG